MPPMLVASPGSRPTTASNLKALVENINQEIDGMTTWLLTIEQHVSTAPQNIPQPPVREHPQQESTPVRDHPHSGLSARQWPSAGQRRHYTSGVWSQSSSVSQTTQSNKEDLNGHGDPREPEAVRLEDDNRNWAMELQAHITQYEKAAHNAWQQQYETYTSLLELAEHQQTALGTIAGHTDQYVEAGHIRSEMLCRLDQYLQSRPGGTDSRDSAEAKRMRSARAECTRAAEHEGPGVNPANSVRIPEHTDSLPKRVLMLIEHKLNQVLCLCSHSVQTVLPHHSLTRQLWRMSPIVCLGLSD